MKNLYNTMVLFLVVIMSMAGLLSCTRSNDDQDIVMVVDDDNSSTQQIMEIVKAVDNSTTQVLQAGRFRLEDDKLLKLLRVTNVTKDCVKEDQPCGALDWCCGGLTCVGGPFKGTCRPDPDDPCVEVDQPCGAAHRCCGDLRCDGIFKGKCRAPDYCTPIGSSCSAFRGGVPCCDDGFCDSGVFGTCRGKDYCLPIFSECPSMWPCCIGTTCLYDIRTYDLRCLNSM